MPGREYGVYPLDGGAPRIDHHRDGPGCNFTKAGLVTLRS